MPTSVTQHRGSQSPTGNDLVQKIQTLQNDVAALQAIVQAGTASATYVVRDGTGNQRVQMGLLNNGDYGFQVIDVNGNATEYLPTYVAPEITSEQGTASTSYVDLSTAGPSLTAIIGQSGSAWVSVNAYVATPGSATSIQGGAVGVSVDGGTPSGQLSSMIYVQVSSGSSGTGVLLGSCGIGLVTGLTPGSHTFKMQYKSTGTSGTIYFGNRILQVKPI